MDESGNNIFSSDIHSSLKNLRQRQNYREPWLLLLLLLLIGNLPRPPQTSIRDFTEILNTVLVQIREDTNLKKCELILVGDFNIDILKTEIHVETSKYLDTLLDHNLLPVISKPMY